MDQSYIPEGYAPRLNAIADPNRIYGGQVLKIPLS